MAFWGRKKDFTRIPVAQLQPGMHISLAERWWDHPFLLSEFTLESRQQIQTIAGIGMSHVLWSRDGSSAGPLEPMEASATVHEEPIHADALAQERTQRERRREQSRRATERMREAARNHMHASSALRDALSKLHAAPRSAVQKSAGVVMEAAAAFAAEGNVSIVLLDDRVSGTRLHTHAINVMLLSMMIGRSQRWGVGPLGELGLGGLFHDAGLLRIPDTLRMRPESEWTLTERTHIQEHTTLGATMMQGIPEFPPGAQAVVAMHHEHWDGSGYPVKLAGEKIPLPARYAAVANRYDELCHPISLIGACSPAEALARMFKLENAHFDPELLTRFIKLMGIYPPGSLVELSNGAIGLVTGINRDQTLRPLVMLWQEGIRSDDAPVIDLTNEPELSISRGLRESDLEPEVRDYLNPRLRTAYFYAREDAGSNPAPAH